MFKNGKIYEWVGSIAAAIYLLLVAMNIGAEFIGFALLLISAMMLGIWAFMNKHKAILILQFFCASASILGMIRWYG